MAKAGRPSKGMTLSKHNIELAIKSTQSMGQAALYMNVSKNTFKKYKWPTIDVTRKSVEETAASVIKIYEIYKQNV